MLKEVFAHKDRHHYQPRSDRRGQTILASFLDGVPVLLLPAAVKPVPEPFQRRNDRSEILSLNEAIKQLLQGCNGLGSWMFFYSLTRVLEVRLIKLRQDSFQVFECNCLECFIRIAHVQEDGNTGKAFHKLLQEIGRASCRER